MECIIMNPQDNVATVLKKCIPGDKLIIADTEMKEVGNIMVTEEIPFAHKVCLQEIKEGDPVIKYGQVIGKAKSHILPGNYVHVHNVVSIAGAGRLQTD